LLVTDIERQQLPVAALFADHPQGAGGLFFAGTVIDKHVIACGREFQADGASYPSRSAGYQRTFHGRGLDCSRNSFTFFCSLYLGWSSTKVGNISLTRSYTAPVTGASFCR